MNQPQSSPERSMYVAPPDGVRTDPYVSSWKRVSRDTGGVPLKFARLVTAPNGERHALYVPADAESFVKGGRKVQQVAGRQKGGRKV